MATFILHLTVDDHRAVEMSNALRHTLDNPALVEKAIGVGVQTELVYDPSRDPESPAYIFRRPNHGQ